MEKEQEHDLEVDKLLSEIESENKEEIEKMGESTDKKDDQPKTPTQEEVPPVPDWNQDDANAAPKPPEEDDLPSPPKEEVNVNESTPQQEVSIPQDDKLDVPEKTQDDFDIPVPLPSGGDSEETSFSSPEPPSQEDISPLPEQEKEDDTNPLPLQKEDNLPVPIPSGEENTPNINEGEVNLLPSDQNEGVIELGGEENPKIDEIPIPIQDLGAAQNQNVEQTAQIPASPINEELGQTIDEHLTQSNTQGGFPQTEQKVEIPHQKEWNEVLSSINEGDNKNKDQKQEEVTKSDVPTTQESEKTLEHEDHIKKIESKKEHHKNKAVHKLKHEHKKSKQEKVVYNLDKKTIKELVYAESKKVLDDIDKSIEDENKRIMGEIKSKEIKLYNNLAHLDEKMIELDAFEERIKQSDKEFK